MRQAWVRQLWKARPQHHGPRLVCDEVGPPPTVPLHSMRGNAQHEHGDRVPRSSLQSTGVRPGREPTSRGRQHFCDRPSDGPEHRGLLAWRLGRARRVSVFGRVGPPRCHVCHDRWPARTLGLDATCGAQTGGVRPPAARLAGVRRALTRWCVARGEGAGRCAGWQGRPGGAAGGLAPPAPVAPDRRPVGPRRRAVPARG